MEGLTLEVQLDVFAFSLELFSIPPKISIFIWRSRKPIHKMIHLSIWEKAYYLGEQSLEAEGE